MSRRFWEFLELAIFCEKSKNRPFVVKRSIKKFCFIPLPIVMSVYSFRFCAPSHKAPRKIQKSLHKIYTPKWEYEEQIHKCMSLLLANRQAKSWNFRIFGTCQPTNKMKKSHFLFRKWSIFLKNPENFRKISSENIYYYYFECMEAIVLPQNWKINEITQ